MLGFVRLVFVVMLMAIVGLTSAIATMHFAIHGAEVPIPDFRGMTIANATERAADLGLSLKVENHLYSAEIPAGHIMNQAPASGTVVRRGWHVWLTESIGQQKLAIPGLLGRDQRLATMEVRRAGLQTSIVAQLPWAGAQPGTVIAQSPEPNATGVERPVVNLLLVAEDQEPREGLVMPDVEGELFSAAAETLLQKGLRVSPAREQAIAVGTANPAPGQPSAAPVPPGTVIRQNPPAGYRVDSGTQVELTVAK